MCVYGNYQIDSKLDPNWQSTYRKYSNLSLCPHYLGSIQTMAMTREAQAAKFGRIDIFNAKKIYT